MQSQVSKNICFMISWYRSSSPVNFNLNKTCFYVYAARSGGKHTSAELKGSLKLRIATENLRKTILAEKAERDRMTMEKDDYERAQLSLGICYTYVCTS